MLQESEREKKAENSVTPPDLLGLENYKTYYAAVEDILMVKSSNDRTL